MRGVTVDARHRLMATQLATHCLAKLSLVNLVNFFFVINEVTSNVV